MLAREEVRSGQRTTCGNWLSTMCVLYVRLRSLGLTVIAFTLLAPNMYGEAGVGVGDRIACMFGPVLPLSNCIPSPCLGEKV